MWSELIAGIAADAVLGAPAGPEELAEVERALGQRLPRGLAELLRECGGVGEDAALEVVWSAGRIARENAQLRTDPSLARLYMPFEPLLFFGSGPGGDLFGCPRTPEREEVFVWDHETDSRTLVCYRLEDYLRRALTEGGGDWWRAD
ncbi:SMI1/KNR4 family protein [Kitasatospora phosalacinea]|uniref:SMI1/KNR4 family protein n=1 Tax=Kitasatospora phosalacinea TaxID=2065 RepID=A0A9W6Q930_9ACTN|nr:SMI1/KNR4 family protein [Kitasatospora phosalacinea]GLW70332.1 SMI1/KNR4 family protein [Kitasatospora phosalacinea]